MGDLGTAPKDFPVVGETEHDDAKVGWTPQDDWAELFGEEGSQIPFIVDPHDGLPRPADDVIQGAAPALTEDSFVCMADVRGWVHVQDEDADTGMWDEAIRQARNQGHAIVCPDNIDEVWNKDGTRKPLSTFTDEQTREAFGVRWSVDGDGSLGWPVQPVRPTCRHLKRMLITDQTVTSTDGPVVPMHSYCMALRIEGEPMSLGDQAVWACELRDPPDPATANKIEERVQRKAKEGRERRMLPIMQDAAPEPEWEKQGAEIRWSGAHFQFDADPAVAPGQIGHLHIWAPAHLVSLTGRGKLCDDMVFVGTEWMPGEVFSGRKFPGCAYHTLLLMPRHISPVVPPPPEWLDGWPGRVDNFLATAIQNQPPFMAKRLLAGKSVVVTAAHRRHALWYAAMIVGAIDPKHKILSHLTPTHFPEGDHVLRQKGLLA